MKSFRRLAVATWAAAVGLVTLGAAVRTQGAGLGCGVDWPRCGGRLFPSFGDTLMVIEWSHRLVASLLGFMVLSLAIFAWVKFRGVPGVFWPSIAALGFVVLQGWLGRQVVVGELPRNLVLLHFSTAMIVVGLLVLVAVNAHLHRGGNFGRTARVGLVLVGCTVAAWIYGALVAQRGATLVFADWPLMNGSLIPSLGTPARASQFHHRLIVMALGLVLVWMILTVRRAANNRLIARVAHLAAGLWLLQVAIGAMNIFLRAAAWVATTHVAVGALFWSTVVALSVLSYRKGTSASHTEASQSVDASGVELEGSSRGGPVSRISAYFALTKPRIIELLLITTIPAMVLAADGWPATTLVIATVLGGTLAAASANAINCYFDRDIDKMMRRTSSRPLPTGAVEPERALLFGVVVGVAGVALLAATTTPAAAVAAAAAIAFYIFVYTLALKRSTPANIVIGGAAGGAPVLVGWAAVTGEVGLPALLMFALVFYWTPPHFWALALRHADDYRRAGVPMLPVVRGVEETTRQMVAYSVITVAVSLLLYAASNLGWIYLVSSLVGGVVLVALTARVRKDPSQRVAMSMFRGSIGYLAILFVATGLDRFIGASRPPGVSIFALLGIVGLLVGHIAVFGHRPFGRRRLFGHIPSRSTAG